MATEHYLEITDATDSVVIATGTGGATDYKLQYLTWAPTMGGLRASPLAGRGPYEDVTESMTLIVSGATVPTVLLNVAKLARLLDNAERWARGENTPAVTLKFSPKGGTVSSVANPMTSIILGRAPGDQTAGMQLPVTWGDVGTTQLFMTDVQVRFRRRTPWLHTTTSAASASAVNGDLASITIAATTTPSPTKIELTNYGYGKQATPRFHGGYLLLGEPVGGSNPIVITTAESVAGVNFSSVAGGDNARNTNVLRYTPITTAEDFSGGLVMALPTASNLVAIFANVRPPTLAPMALRARVDSDIPNQYTPYTAVGLNSLTNRPFWVMLGIVAKVGAITGVYLGVKASAVSGTFDIDTVVAVDARAVQILGLNSPGDTDPNDPSAIVLQTLNVDHLLASSPWPLVTAGTRPIPYAGDAVVSTMAGTLHALLLATGGGTGSNGARWRQSNISTDAVLSNVWTARRTGAYPVAQ